MTSESQHHFNIRWPKPQAAIATLDISNPHGSHRYISITFVDFLEAVCRLADIKPLPSHSELDAAGYESVMAWVRDKEAGQVGDNEAVFQPRPSYTFGAPKTRPLYARLELFLELMFENLYHDPA